MVANLNFSTYQLLSLVKNNAPVAFADSFTPVTGDVLLVGRPVRSGADGTESGSREAWPVIRLQRTVARGNFLAGSMLNRRLLSLLTTPQPTSPLPPLPTTLIVNTDPVLLNVRQTCAIRAFDLAYILSAEKRCSISHIRENTPHR